MGKGQKRGGDRQQQQGYCPPCTPPLLFCADDNHSLYDSKGHTTCVICAQVGPKYFGFGSCHHPDVCAFCIVRLRSILRDNRCPICKEELDKVILSSDTSFGIEEYNLSRLQSKRDLGIFFADWTVYEMVEQLFEYRCWMYECSGDQNCNFLTLEDLKQHLWQMHRRKFCQVCLYSRKVFLKEQLLYDPDDLDRHVQQGDSSDCLGRKLPALDPHPRCDFCKKNFFNKEEIQEHMQKYHQLCGLCQKLGWPNQYFQDYGYLSLHYQEDHYVCMHPACKTENLRLIAFADADELRLHELQEHQDHSNQKARKQATKLTLAIGTASYASQQQNRQSGNSGASSSRAEAQRQQEHPIRFAWTRGWVDSKDAQPQGWDDKDDQQERYPDRHSGVRFRPGKGSKGKGKSQSTTTAFAEADTGWQRREATPAKTYVQQAYHEEEEESEEENDEEKKPPSTGDLHFFNIIQGHINKVGLHRQETLAEPDYKECNKQFKLAIQESLGDELFKDFKKYSAEFRKSLSGGNAPSGSVLSYLQQCLEVLTDTRVKEGENKAAELLCDLITLLPEKKLRTALQNGLITLQEHLKEAEAISRKSSEGRRGSSRRNGAGSQLRAEAPAFTPDKDVGNSLGKSSKSPAMDGKLAAVGVDSAFPHGRWESPVFVPALLAVLEAVVGKVQGPGAARLAIHVPSVVAKVKQRDGEDMDRLENLQSDLTAAGGGTMDFSPLERLLALRPLMFRTLRPHKGAAKDSAKDPAAESWTEWKATARDAIMAFHPEERRCVTAYIDIVMRYSTGGIPAGGHAPDSSSSGPKSSGPKSADFPSLPGAEREVPTRVAPVPKAKGYGSHVAQPPRPIEMDFPELPGVRPAPKESNFSIEEDTDPIQKQAKKKGQRQKQVLLRSGGF